MGFLDQLRMQNIFPSGNGQVLNEGTPFGMPDLSRGNINPNVVDSLTNKALDFRYNLANPTAPHQTFNTGYHPSNNGQPGSGINPAMMPGTSTTPPMNVVWGTDSFKEGNINPLDKIKLQQNADKIRQTGEKNNATAELGRSKLDLSGELGRGKLDVSQQRADAADFKAKHPNAQFLQPKGGNIMLYDPASQTMHDTGVSTGTMTQEDFMNGQSGNRMSEIGARGDIQNELQKTKGEQNLAGIAARVAGQKEKQKIGALPTQQKVDYANKAQKLINTRPELSQFIKFNSDGTFNIVAPSTGIAGGHHGPTEEQYKQISDGIYGAGSDIALPPDSKVKGGVKTEVKPDKDNDPLGIRPKGDDFESDDEE